MSENIFIEQFKTCKTAAELKELREHVRKTDDIILAGRARQKQINEASKLREREIRAAELAPFEDEAKRMRKGQKVYFAGQIDSVAMGWDFRFIKGTERKVKAGQWCRVWQYQPRAKRLWLCRPGTSCQYENVMRDSFSLAEMQAYGISRVELDLRKQPGAA